MRSQQTAPKQTTEVNKYMSFFFFFLEIREIFLSVMRLHVRTSERISSES